MSIANISKQVAIRIAVVIKVAERSFAFTLPLCHPRRRYGYRRKNAKTARAPAQTSA